MLRQSNRFLWAGCLVVSIGWLGCDGHPTSPDVLLDGQYMVGESFTYELSGAGHTGLRLEGINGSIVITGDPAAHSIRVTGERRVGSYSRADAEAHLRELEVQCNDLAGEVLVKTVQPRESEGRTYIVDYEVAVPSELEVAVLNINGEVRLEGLRDSAFVDLVNGEINGSVSFPVEGVIDMSTVNGTIDLRIPVDTSARLSASVVNGRIEWSNLNLRNQTVTPQFLQGVLGDGRGRISLSVVNGNIRVRGT